LSLLTSDLLLFGSTNANPSFPSGHSIVNGINQFVFSRDIPVKTFAMYCVQSHVKSVRSLAREQFAGDSCWFVTFAKFADTSQRKLAAHVGLNGINDVERPFARTTSRSWNCTPARRHFRSFFRLSSVDSLRLHWYLAHRSLWRNFWFRSLQCRL